MISRLLHFISSFKNSQTRNSAIYLTLCLSLLLTGIIFRIHLFLFNRTLWLDELLLAHNLGLRSYAGMFSGLDFGQSAPILFLLIEKTLYLINPTSEAVLRLFPLISGILAVILYFFLARRLFPNSVLFLLAAFALAARPVYYASEVKQYSSDILIAILILWIVIVSIDKLTTQRLLWICLMGSISVWLSHPAIFTLAGIGFVLIVNAFLKRDFKTCGLLTLIGLIWIGSFGLQYRLTMLHLSENRFLFNYWDDGFIPTPPWSDWNWFPTAWNNFLDYCGYSKNVALVLSFLFLGGIVISLKKNWRIGLMLLLPLLFTLIASYLRYYPFSRRLILFLLPLILFQAGFLIEWLFTLGRNHSRFYPIILGALLAVFLIYYPITRTWRMIDRPVNKENVKPFMNYLAGHRKPNDTIYLYYPAQHAFYYYGETFGFSPDDYIISLKTRNDISLYAEDIDQLKGRRRVWFFAVHPNILNGVNEIEYMLNYMDKIGVKKEVMARNGVYLYRYDFR